MIIGLALRNILVDSKERLIVNKTYLEVLNKYDDVSIICLSNTNDLTSILKLCDAFILPGGRDINPTYYGEHNISSDIDTDSDLLDKKIIEYAFDNKKPLLGICRGIQSINVFLGGSLYQDIKNHSNSNHQVILYKNGIYKDKIITTNSFHHQTLKKIAPDFNILGISTDNHIEIIEHKSLPILGVQYHPELNDRLVFDYFIKKIRIYKS